MVNLSKIVTLLVETFLPAIAVILHCLDRKGSSACFCSNDINDIDATTGIFQVNSTEAHQYTVNFNIPSCSCPNWMQHHYPCKHFLRSFMHIPSAWDWNALPQSYLASPRLSLDTDALSTYSSDDSSMVNLHRMETWVWGFTKCKHRKMTVQSWDSTQQNFQREKSVLHNY